MTWYECIIAVHRAVTDQVSHGGRLKSRRYFVWQEAKPRDFIADGVHCERVHRGSSSLYTTQEFDPWAEKFEQAMNGQSNIAWKCEGKWPDEADTHLWHYEWSWEVTDCGEDHGSEGV